MIIAVLVKNEEEETQMVVSSSPQLSGAD